MAAKQTLAFVACIMVSMTARGEVTLHEGQGSKVLLHGTVQARGQRQQYAGGGGAVADSELRRLELRLEGEFASQWSWAVGYDSQAEIESFWGEATLQRGRWLDAYVRYEPVANWRFTVGQFKQGNGMESRADVRDSDFVELTAASQTHALAYRPGLAIEHRQARWGATLGAFDSELEEDQLAPLARGRGAVAGAYFSPISAEGQLLHVGISWVAADAQPVVVHPLFPGRDPYAQLPVPYAHSVRTGQAELAYVLGPAKLQMEGFSTRVTRTDQPSYALNSWYASVLWNVTGEDWQYANGLISAPPSGSAAHGLWQVGLRYQQDIDDDQGYWGHRRWQPGSGGLQKGQDRLGRWTLALNWWWRQHLKLSLELERGNDDGFTYAGEYSSYARSRSSWHTQRIQAQLHW